MLDFRKKVRLLSKYLEIYLEEETPNTPSPPLPWSRKIELCERFSTFSETLLLSLEMWSGRVKQ